MGGGVRAQKTNEDPEEDFEDTVRQRCYLGPIFTFTLLYQWEICRKNVAFKSLCIKEKTVVALKHYFPRNVCAYDGESIGCNSSPNTHLFISTVIKGSS